MGDIDDENWKELREEVAAIRATRVYRKSPEYKRDRSKLATAAHKVWLANLTEEEKKARHRRNNSRPNASIYKLQMRHKRKAELVAYMGGKCYDCGGIFPPQVFDFHHTDPANKTSIVAVMYQHKMETLMKEVAGCVMICANCHRIRHGTQQ